VPGENEIIYKIINHDDLKSDICPYVVDLHLVVDVNGVPVSQRVMKARTMRYALPRLRRVVRFLDVLETLVKLIKTQPAIVER
jgi:hypothetical protein